MLSYLEAMASTAGRAKNLINCIERLVKDTEARIKEIKQIDMCTNTLSDLRVEVGRVREEGESMREEIDEMMAWKSNEKGLLQRVAELQRTEQKLDDRNQFLQEENDELRSDK